MSNFTKITAALAVADKTAEFELYELAEDPTPVLILKPAGIENKAFFNAALRSGAAAARGKKLSEQEQIETGIREMRELWPQHVVQGWRGIRNDAGEELAYTEALGRELLEALTVDVLLRLKAFAQDMANFRAAGDPAPIDAGTVAGN
jgi:hypothetical protein